MGCTSSTENAVEILLKEPRHPCDGESRSLCRHTNATLEHSTLSGDNKQSVTMPSPDFAAMHSSGSKHRLSFQVSLKSSPLPDTSFHSANGCIRLLPLCLATSGGECIVELDDEQIQACYINATDKRRDSRFKCGRASKFKPVVSCGAFTWNTGNYVDGLVIGDEFVSDHWRASSRVLSPMTEYRNEETRAELCLEWVRRVLLPFHWVLEDSVEEMKRMCPTFSGYHPPLASLATAAPNVITKQVTVTMWVKWPEAGDEHRDYTYRQASFEFGEDAGCLPVTILQSRVLHLPHTPSPGR